MARKDKPKLLKIPSSRYDVGYGKPPEASQFKPGQSGNPKGRPKGARNRAPINSTEHSMEQLKSIIMSEAYRPIKINEGNKQITLPIIQAAMRALAVNAAKGQHRAQALLTQLVTGIETSKKTSHEEWMFAVMEYKSNWEIEVEHRRRYGLNLPDPIPHPDDLIVDLVNNQVIIKGPFMPEEHARWRKAAELRDDTLEELEEQKKSLQNIKDKHKRRILEENIALNTRIYKILRSKIGDWPRRGL